LFVPATQSTHIPGSWAVFLRPAFHVLQHGKRGGNAPHRVATL
jgi:hypothetical protein